MIFCGQCGFQLSPGDTTCPRCGAQTEANLLDKDPGINNPTEISHAILESPRRNQMSQTGPTIAPHAPQQPLRLGSDTSNYQTANDETTSMMEAQTYPPQQGYNTYPPQQMAGSGAYGYPAGGGYPQPSYQQPGPGGQQAALAQWQEANNRGKTGALLLILFGLLLLIGAVVVLLLTFQ